ncbi:putative signal transducing protein [Pedobacter alpinus]|uniref:Signal transducing protein n=1 Tax=Pedobacter alpinus TaxID=1590643 RepID=A0ABW5TNN9_9SPHI
MDKNWVKIYASGDFYRAEIVKQVLIDHQIEAVIMNKQDTSYKFGEVEVHIQEENTQKASEIISQNDL